MMCKIEGCGKHPYTPIGATKASDYCPQHWWKSLKDEHMGGKLPYYGSAICRVCNEEFDRTVHNQKTCSDCLCLGSEKKEREYTCEICEQVFLFSKRGAIPKACPTHRRQLYSKRTTAWVNRQKETIA